MGSDAQRAVGGIFRGCQFSRKNALLGMSRKFSVVDSRIFVQDYTCRGYMGVAVARIFSGGALFS